MPYHLRVDGIVGRVTEGEVVDGIEHIRLAHTVLADETVDLRREIQRGRLDVFIVDER